MSKKYAAFSKENFHQTTAMLITNVLRQYNLPPAAVEDLNLRSLCLHLNPLAELPTARSIYQECLNAQGSSGYAITPCILCGKVLSKDETQFLTDQTAAVYLTTAVITDKTIMKRAKKAMINEKLVFCQRHTSLTPKTMFDALCGQTYNSIDEIPDYAFLGGLAVYNNLMKMRSLFLDEDYEEMTDGQFRALITRWINKDQPAIHMPLRYHPPRRKRQFPIGVESVEDEEEEEDVPSSESIPTATANVSEKSLEEALAAIESTVAAQKEIKLEEPDLNYPQTSGQSSSSTTHPCESEQQQREKSFIPMNLTVYTLKNGKKVVKAPKIAGSPALAGSGGKLVTYRVAKRKVIRKPMEPEQVMEEEKPEFLL